MFTLVEILYYEHENFTHFKMKNTKFWKIFISVLADAGNPHQQPEIGSSGKYSMSSANGVRNDSTSPTVAAAVAAVANHLNGHVTNGTTGQAGGAGSAAGAVAGQGGGKGGKGIRNRVFCGECEGCLKNDDCGKCR